MRISARANSDPMKPAAPVMSITESAVSAGLLFVLVLGAALALDDNGSMLSMKGSSSVSSAGARKTRLVRRRSVSVNAAVIDGRAGFTRRRAMVHMVQYSCERRNRWPIFINLADYFYWKGIYRYLHTVSFPNQRRRYQFLNIHIN